MPAATRSLMSAASKSAVAPMIVNIDQPIHRFGQDVFDPRLLPLAQAL